MIKVARAIALITCLGATLALAVPASARPGTGTELSALARAGPRLSRLSGATIQRVVSFTADA